MAFITAALTTLGTIASSIGAAGATAAAAAGGAAATGATVAGAALGTTATTIGAVGTAASLAGTGVSVYGNLQSAEAQQRAEALRARQMRLEAKRATRESIRQGMVARSQGLLGQSAGGAEIAGSSAYGGLIGQNTTNTQFDINAIRQNTAIGEGLFKANIAQSQGEAVAGVGRGIGNFGGVIAENNMQLARIKTSLFG